MRPSSTTRPLAQRLATTTASGAAAGDLVGVARAVFDTVAYDVPFAFACLAATDPTSGLITTAVKSEPLAMGDREFAAAEYGAPDVNQLVDLARRPVPVGVLSLDTGGRPQECRRLAEYMTPSFGFVDEIRLVCRSGGTTWAALGIYRRAGEPWFDAADGERLASAGPAVADAVRAALFASPAPRPDTAAVPAVLLVDGGDVVAGSSAAADAVVADLGGLDHGALPAGVLAVAATARARNAMASARIRGASGWVRVQGLPLDGSEAGRVVLTVAPASAGEVGSMTVAARGLTSREQDVVGLVLQGASTAVIAAALHLSAHTVQDHLKAVFAKLGVSSRRELVAALGTA